LIGLFLFSRYRKEQQKKGKHGGKQAHPHHVVAHQGPGKKAAKADHGRKDIDPLIEATGDLASHIGVTLSENLSTKDRHVIEKLEAKIEYEEAHEHPAEAKKIRERIEAINSKAEAKHKAEHGEPIKVIHSGGHKHKKDHE